MDVAAMCDELAAGWLRVWELGREAMKLPGGPSEDEVEDAMDKAFIWHDLAEKARAKEGA